MAYRPIGLCGMGKKRPKGKGLEGGHILQAKEMSRLVAPFRARYYCPDGPQATQTSGLCTLGFEKVKAAGLVQVNDLLLLNIHSERIRGVSLRKTGRLILLNSLADVMLDAD